MKFKRIKISACKPKSNYVLWLRFDDGLEGDVDLSNLVGQGVFRAWEDKEKFDAVRIDPESGTVCWDGEIDLDPYVLHEDVLKTLKLKPKSKKRAPAKQKATFRSRAKSFKKS